MSVLPYSLAGSVFAQIKAKHPNADIQETTYRYYHKLTATSLPFNLNLVTGTGSLQPGEHFISTNDGAVLYRGSIALVKVDTKSKGNINNYPSYCYPDLSVFDGAADVTQTPATQTEAGCLESIYNGGHIQLKANSTILLDRLSTERFRSVPITQSAAGTEHASYNGETPQMVAFVQPQILTGKDTLEVIVSHGSGADLSQIGGGPDDENYLVITFDAFVLKNYAQSVTSGNLTQALQHSTTGR